MPNKKQKRVTDFTAKQLLAGVEALRVLAASLDGTIHAMIDSGVKEIPIDGYAQLDRGLDNIRRFAANAQRGVTSRQIEQPPTQKSRPPKKGS